MADDEASAEEVPAPHATRDMDADGDIDADDTTLEAEVLIERAGALADATDGRVRLDADGLPAALSWRPHFEWKAMVAGAAADVAVELTLQQMGWIVLDTADLVMGMAQGAVLGALAPMMGRLFGMLYVNNRIAKMRAA